MEKITKKQIQWLLDYDNYFKGKEEGQDYWIRYKPFKRNNFKGWWVEYKENNKLLGEIIVGYALGNTLASINNNLKKIGGPCDSIKFPIEFYSERAPV